MLNKVLPVIVLAILSGCVSTKNIPIDHSKVELMKPERILISKRNKTDFVAMTSAKGSTGLFGALAASKKYNFNVIENEMYIETDNVSEILAAYPGTDWILDIETIGWSFYYFPTDWDYYRVMYSAKLRLIDTRDKAIIAEGFCARIPEQSDESLSYDELLEKNAEGLKSELRIAAKYCIDEFKKNVLKI